MLTLDELEHDPQIRARNMIVEVETPTGEKVKQVGISVKLSETPGLDPVARAQARPAYRRNPGDLGYKQNDIERWRAEGAIR